MTVVLSDIFLCQLPELEVNEVILLLSSSSPSSSSTSSFGSSACSYMELLPSFRMPLLPPVLSCLPMRRMCRRAHMYTFASVFTHAKRIKTLRFAFADLHENAYIDH